jgi:hypothetical protein
VENFWIQHRNRFPHESGRQSRLYAVITEIPKASSNGGENP